MQILGKKSKVLLIAVAIAMLIAVGASFAMWDMSAVKATSGNLSNYANAKVGDIVEFGRYYQTGNKVSVAKDAEYEKTPIEWLVVDKDERTGQLTLMSKYILAAGSYFGNWYYNKENKDGHNYQEKSPEIDGLTYNQAYTESTSRAFLNNLERSDLGGDSYSTADGYKTSMTLSSKAIGKLYTSVGFSNRKYAFTNPYERPITNTEYRNRPATRGFYDEAFESDEKAMIVPKAISGYIGYRWPSESKNYHASYLQGALDKIWLPSATELNIMGTEDNYTNPSDEASSTVFEYFKDKTGTVLSNARIAKRTPFVENNSMAMNYSIPVYKYQSTEINEDIHPTNNSSDWYWTRSPASNYCTAVRYVASTGVISTYGTHTSYGGVRPCMILKY